MGTKVDGTKLDEKVDAKLDAKHGTKVSTIFDAKKEPPRAQQLSPSGLL